MSRCICYKLVEAGKSGVVRYIGQSKQSAEKRLIQHMQAATRVTAEAPGDRVTAWIASVVRLGGNVEIIVIDRNATWNVTEVQLIAQYRADGHPLMNVLDGGLDTLKDLRRRNKSKRKKRAGWAWGSPQNPSVIGLLTEKPQ